MEVYEKGKIKIDNKISLKEVKRNKNKETLANGTIVYCRGNSGTASFIGIVYNSTRVLELENGSNAYINSNDYIHLGDTISYWTIEKVLSARLVVDEILKEI